MSQREDRSHLLKRYEVQVLFQDQWNSTWDEIYEFMAEDKEHAIEQCNDFLRDDIHDRFAYEVEWTIESADLK